jgi:hypothetical protein
LASPASPASPEPFQLLLAPDPRVQHFVLFAVLQIGVDRVHVFYRSHFETCSLPALPFLSNGALFQPLGLLA